MRDCGENHSGRNGVVVEQRSAANCVPQSVCGNCAAGADVLPRSPLAGWDLRSACSGELRRTLQETQPVLRATLVTRRGTTLRTLCAPFSGSTSLRQKYGQCPQKCVFTMRSKKQQTTAIKEFRYAVTEC